ncbi:response regulator transcription factor [Pseudochelatococcus sp. B33]
MSDIPNIAVIDDDDGLRSATENLLSACGFKACTFASAEDYLGSGLVPDTACLITDVQMPGMGGIELQAALLRQGHRKPIIFITAFPEAHLREEVLARGAVAFLSKPFEVSELLAHVESALERNG